MASENTMTETGKDEGVSEPRPADPRGFSGTLITKTKKHTNAFLPDDYQEVNRELKKAIRRVKELVSVKNELELQAVLTGVLLPSVNLTEGALEEVA